MGGFAVPGAAGPVRPPRRRAAGPGPGRPAGPAQGAPGRPRPGPCRRPARPPGAGAQAGAPSAAIARTPFIVFVTALLGGGLICLLVINTILATGSYQITSLQQAQTARAQQVQVLKQQVAEESAPSVIANAGPPARHGRTAADQVPQPQHRPDHPPARHGAGRSRGPGIHPVRDGQGDGRPGARGRRPPAATGPRRPAAGRRTRDGGPGGRGEAGHGRAPRSAPDGRPARPGPRTGRPAGPPADPAAARRPPAGTARVVRPGVARPEVAHPGVMRPGVLRPGAVRPGAGPPGGGADQGARPAAAVRRAAAR